MLNLKEAEIQLGEVGERVASEYLSPKDKNTAEGKPWLALISKHSPSILSCKHPEVFRDSNIELALARARYELAACLVFNVLDESRKKMESIYSSTPFRVAVVSVRGDARSEKLRSGVAEFCAEVGIDGQDLEWLGKKDGSDWVLYGFQDNGYPLLPNPDISFLLKKSTKIVECRNDEQMVYMPTRVPWANLIYTYPGVDPDSDEIFIPSLTLRIARPSKSDMRARATKLKKAS